MTRQKTRPAGHEHVERWIAGEDMDLAEFIADRSPILLDGAMGTQLANRGLSMGGENNLTNPEEVAEIHKQYAACGCHILITNTLTMNRVYIETHNIGVDVSEVNLAGVRLAKSVAGKNLYVLGDLSSTGKMLKPYGDLSEREAEETFKEQASFLSEGGVDGFIIETIIDLREALCALHACKSISSLPVIVSLAFSTTGKGARTIMGNSAMECAKALTEAGANAIGSNCGELDPSQMAEIISIFRGETSLPILAQPNAGNPKLVNDQTIFDMTPEAFASGMVKCFRAGACLIGGCCGTSPAHISAVANIL